MAESVTVSEHPFPAGVTVGVYESFDGLDYGSQTRDTAPKNPAETTAVVPDDLEIDLSLDVGEYFLAANFNGVLTQGLRFDAKVPDGISVALVDPDDTSQSLAVTVDGQTIEVSLATDSSGDIETTLGDVAAALNGDTDAHALVETSVTVDADTVAEAEATVVNRDAIRGWQFVGFSVVAS
jgi:hypothetical protein